MTWAQAPRPAAQMVDTAVTPKIVLPAAASSPKAWKPAPLPSDVAAAAEKNQPFNARPAVQAQDTRWKGVVQASAVEPAPQAPVASKFVPAVRPPATPTTVRRVNETEPSPQKTAPTMLPEPRSAAPARLPDLTPAAPAIPEALPAPTTQSPPLTPTPRPACGNCCKECCSDCCKPACGTADDAKPALHPLLAWFTFWPKTTCHACQPAPHIPRVYEFFLDNCKPVPLPPPTHPGH
jgi:hypothetical protein